MGELSTFTIGVLVVLVELARGVEKVLMGLLRWDILGEEDFGVALPWSATVTTIMPEVA